MLLASFSVFKTNAMIVCLFCMKEKQICTTQRHLSVSDVATFLVPSNDDPETILNTGRSTALGIESNRKPRTNSSG